MVIVDTNRVNLVYHVVSYTVVQVNVEDVSGSIIAHVSLVDLVSSNEVVSGNDVNLVVYVHVPIRIALSAEILTSTNIVLLMIRKLKPQI